jgi:hypothetical protein
LVDYRILPKKEKKEKKKKKKPFFMCLGLLYILVKLFPTGGGEEKRLGRVKASKYNIERL